MTHEPKNLKYETLEPLLKEKNLILVSKEDRDEAIDAIKTWIALTMSEHYGKDPKKMIEDAKYVFQFRVVNWIEKPILITK